MRDANVPRHRQDRFPGEPQVSLPTNHQQAPHHDGDDKAHRHAAVTAGDKIEALRQWASGRVLSADQPGIYSRESGADGNSRVRRVMREPGRN